MSSVAVNCCSVPQKWPTMPSDVIYTITQSDRTLVVEDNERAAKAAEGTDRKETTHLNGNAHRVSNHVQALSQTTFRSRFTIPRVPSTPTYGAYGIHPESPGVTNGAGDTVDTIVVAPKTKLKSFQERSPHRHEYYHDARFLQSEVSLGSSNEPVEKDDEGDHHDDHVHPLPNDVKEKSSMYVQLPQKHNAQCTDLPPSLQEPLVDQYSNQRSNQSPSKEKKLSNNNKDPEAEVESSCAVDCLYYTLQCCDCSIM
ncbi:hypothetical protein GE061_005585 [Apolygus lucorum]|uniref:Uncharacterized protein n=1 Tax=Apolygus lucorum TaxID=248454 RepID=A0A8S9WYF5_APOLU|nr:hypothetical protein GE061_005585 [Apolygus lucorum]